MNWHTTGLHMVISRSHTKFGVSLQNTYARPCPRNAPHMCRSMRRGPANRCAQSIFATAGTHLRQVRSPIRIRTRFANQLTRQNANNVSHYLLTYPVRGSFDGGVTENPGQKSRAQATIALFAQKPPLERRPLLLW